MKPSRFDRAAASKKKKKKAGKTHEDARQQATGLDTYHVFRVHNFRCGETGQYELLVRWCGYPKKDSNWEPYTKIWYCRPELVEEYFEQQNGMLPLSLPKQTDDTSDEDEPDTSDGEGTTHTLDGEPVAE
ncbi:hypothetical protein ACHAPU_002958 [Fusarium lateritium]